MKKYYLYGAGINCVAVIKFLGAQRVIAIIDSDETKHGKKVEGINIISLKDYKDQNNGETIVITGFYNSSEIAAYLKEQGIEDYYVSPYMQMGFYEDVKDMIDKLELTQYAEIVCCTENPITELIEEELKNIRNGSIVKYIDRDRLRNVGVNTPIIVTNQEDNSFWQDLDHAEVLYNVLDINLIYEKKYGFRNKDILRFKDIHKGERCFVIGNGPSLRYEDLELLYSSHEICFGANRIYLSYEHTRWRPDYYVAVDYTIVQNDRKKILEMSGIRFIRHFYKMVEKWNQPEIYEFRGLVNQPGDPRISEDMYEGIYTGNTVVYDAIQIALYMGFQEIYLLGVDMTAGIRYQDEGAHFYKSPDTNENLGKGNTPEAKKCLGYAAEVIEKTGKKLRNATRGGELDEVIRVDFDSLFQKYD